MTAAAPLPRVPTGIAGLDTILRGGFIKGGLYLIQGTPGTGKTLLANQICFHHAAAERRVLYVTLLAEYHTRMADYIAAMSFYDESKIPDSLSYVSGFRVLREAGLSGLLTLVRREIVAKRLSLLMLDGLVAAQRTAGDEQSFNEFIHELQGIAIATECTLFLVSSTDPAGQIKPEHTMVDGILELADQNVGSSAARALSVTKLRGTAYLRGRHSYDIDHRGLHVQPRLESFLAPASAGRSDDDEVLSIGNATLDRMFYGGVMRGSSTLIVGPAGVGKTTFGLHYLKECSAAEPGLLFGFYEMPRRVAAKARLVCAPLSARLDEGIVQVLWQPAGDATLDSYAERLLSAVRERGVRRLFLDGLSAFEDAAGASGRLRLYLAALMNALRGLGVTTVCSLETENIDGPNIRTLIGNLSAIGENTVLLRYDEAGGRLHRYVSILKVRDRDFDPRVLEFTLTGEGPRIGEPAAQPG